MDRNLELFRQLALSSSPSLVHPALVISRLEYPSLDLAPYLDWFESKGEALAEASDASDSSIDRVQQLNYFFYEVEKFGPNRRDYYDPKNSFLSDVMERRLGIPISLSVIYMELGNYIGLGLQGIGFPGHFLIQSSTEGNFYIDAFNSGQILSRADCEQRFAHTSGGHPFSDEYLRPATNVEILARMLANLQSIYLVRNEFEKVVEVLNWIIAVQPDIPHHYRDRGLVLARMSYPEAAIKDLQLYLASPCSLAEKGDIEELIGRLSSLKVTVH